MTATASWPRLKRVLTSALCNDVTGRMLAHFYRDRVPSRGCIFQTQGIASATKARIFWGIFESAEYRFVRDFLRPDLDTIELGSGIGVISSHVAQRLNEGRRLVCVEANKDILPLLQENLRYNCRHTMAQVVHGAIDASTSPNETVHFARAADHVSSRQAEAIGDNAGDMVTVPAVTLGSLLNDYGITSYQLVMDIEGAEVALIENEGSALAKCQRAIVELHPARRGNRKLEVAEIALSFANCTGLKQLDRYGNVFAFARS